MNAILNIAIQDIEEGAINKSKMKIKQNGSFVYIFIIFKIQITDLQRYFTDFNFTASRRGYSQPMHRFTDLTRMQ